MGEHPGQGQAYSTTEPDSRRGGDTRQESRNVLVRGSALGAALVVFLLALFFYAITTAPGLALSFGGTDGWELAVAVHTLGVPHPTGYPTYVLLAQAARALPWGTLAGRLNLFSALCAALTAGLVALAAAELFPAEEQRFPALVATLTAGLTLATADLFWSQAIVAEVYTLHTLFVALAAWLLLRWRRRGGALLPLAGLALGLGMGNHVSLAFVAIGAVAFLVVHRRRPTRREWLWTIGAFLAGLLVYLYLPLRAAADPWLNWGNPRTWAAFWEHVSGAAYRHYLFQVPLGQVFGRISAVARLLLGDFVFYGVLLGLVGAIVLGWRDRALLLLLGIPGGLGLLLAITYGGVDSYVHLLPLYVGGALCAGVAAGMATLLLRRRWGSRVALVALLLPLLSLPLFVRGWEHWKPHDRPPLSPQQWEEGTLEAVPRDGVALTNLDEHTFALWYLQVVGGFRPDVAVVDVRLLEWPWYRAQLASRYPGLVVPEHAAGEWLQALLAANASRPAVALGKTVPLPKGYGLRLMAWSLFEVVPPPPLSPPC